ncbi:MAG: hypothetical protein V9G04_12475 [Nocardioides sp.]|jgi:TolA-binding protein
MSQSTVIVLIVVLVVLALAVAIGAVIAGRKKIQQAEAHREQAHELRRDVGTGTTVRDADLEARERQLEADRARLEAEQAEARAQEAQQGHAYEEARQEEQLRRADELDPDVDTSARDYSPTTPGAQDTTTTDRPADTGNDSRYDDTDDRHRS